LKKICKTISKNKITISLFELKLCKAKNIKDHKNLKMSKVDKRSTPRKTTRNKKINFVF